MGRATVVFVAGAALVLGVSTIARNLLHLDCIGPVLPEWGCLAAPYPATLPGGTIWFYYGAIAFAGFVACYAARDLVWNAAALIARRLGWLEAVEERKPTGYRIR
jgi:hypothetical protein